MPNIMKLRNEKMMLRVCPVRKFWTRVWSPIRWRRSPISFVSKNDMGSFKSLMKKSLTSDMLMRMEIWRSSHRRMKSVAVRPMTIISSPRSTSQMNPISSCLIPISTIDCVRKGITTCSRHPNSRPRNIWMRYLLYCRRYPIMKRKERRSGFPSLMLPNLPLGSRNMAIPFSTPLLSVDIQCCFISLISHLYFPLPGSAIQK